MTKTTLLTLAEFKSTERSLAIAQLSEIRRTGDDPRQIGSEAGDRPGRLSEYLERKLATL